CRGIAAAVGHETMRRLMQRYRQQERQTVDKEGYGLDVHMRRPNAQAVVSLRNSCMRCKATSTSNGSSRDRNCPARSARAAASPESSVTAEATACISSILPLQCKTTSQPAASASRV